MMNGVLQKRYDAASKEALEKNQTKFLLIATRTAVALEWTCSFL